MIRTLLRVVGAESARPVRHTLTLLAAAAVTEGLSYALLVPILRALFGNEPAEAWPWLAAFGAAVAGHAVLRYRGDLAGFRVAATLLRSVFQRFGDHLARLPLGWFTARRTGEISVLGSEGVLQAMSAIAHLLAPLTSASLTPLTIVAVIFAFDWRMGTAALLAVPLVALVQLRTARAMAATDTARSVSGDEASSRVIEYLQAQPVLRAGGRSAERFDLLDDALSGVHRATRRSAISALPGVLGLALTVQAAFTALLALGAYLVIGGKIGAAELLAILVLTARCADPLLSLSDITGKVRAARTELDRLDAVFDTEPLPSTAPATAPVDGQIEFDDVTLRHGGRTVLDNVSLRVPSGSRVAVVGPSGAGKTTLLQLIARFYDVDAGAVRLGCADVRGIDTEELMRHLAVVFQQVYLFDGTMEENVRLGNPDAGTEQVRAAASAAQLDEVIARLPDGWQTRVGEGGSRLSGGERQRVSIARALLKDAPVVLLDEVTSALDPSNEAAVHAGIERLMAGRTVVLVAHRLRTVRHADQIVFLDNGRLVESGTHEELLRNGGRYARFWALSGELLPARHG